jgi:UDP-N-acetylglucosamine 4,6-dehydratase (inverting)
MSLDGESVLITGGTGSFGRAFVETALLRYPRMKRLVIFSRDELKQFEMSCRFGSDSFPCIRYFLGDIRDESRLRRALEGVDVVIHAAALKQVPAAEYNPFECIKTNVLGAQNLIEACLDSGVQRVIALSTDKAAAPINLYGATKLCSDKLFVAANNIRGARSIRFSVVRYGNVFGSRGSVVPVFLSRKPGGILPITHPDMTRFNILLNEGVGLVLWALENSLGGEIFVPKIPSFRVVDLALALGPDCRHEIIGIRPGEKIHEELITEVDSFNTVDLGLYYAIIPLTSGRGLADYCRLKGGTPVKPGFSYNSGTNPLFLGVEELRGLVASLNVTSAPVDPRHPGCE